MGCGIAKAGFNGFDTDHHHSQARSESHRFSTLRWDYLVGAGDDLTEPADRQLLATLRVKRRWPDRSHRRRHFALVAETFLQRRCRGRHSGNAITGIE